MNKNGALGMRAERKYLITTLVIGEEIEKLAELTVPRMQRYAERVDADFIIMGKSDISDRLSPYYEKTQIYSYLDQYEQVLFIDTDILITPDAPDLFEICPKDMVSAVSVDAVYKAVEEEKLLLKELLGVIDWQLPYFNSGVVMFTRQHKQLLNTTDGLIERWIQGKEQNGRNGLNDQSIFNYRANQLNIPVHYIDYSFNFTKARRCFEKRFTMNFIHYAGMKGQRYSRMKIDNWVLNSRFTLWCFKTNALLVKVFDKITSRVP